MRRAGRRVQDIGQNQALQPPAVVSPDENDVLRTHSAELADYREHQLPGILQEVGIVPLAQRTRDGREDGYESMTLYKLYLAMQEPQKKLLVYKVNDTYHSFIILMSNVLENDSFHSVDL